MRRSAVRDLAPARAEHAASCTGIAPLRISCACSCGIRPSASASSTTKVRLRSFDDCEIRCTRSRPNVAQMSDSVCSSERMPRPTSVIAAHGAITFTRHTSARSAHSASSTLVVTRFSLGSSDTVTLVSDEPIRSTDRPWRLKRSNTSARKPTCCHMPMLSIDTSTMPLRRLIALTPGTVAARRVDARAGQIRAFGVEDGHRHARHRGRARSSADAAPWRRWSRFPVLRRNPVAQAGARRALRADWR